MEEHEQSLGTTDVQRIEIQLLLEGMYRVYGFDFRNYAYSSLKRRILHRVQLERLQTISELQARILHDEHAMKRLVNDLSIHVTEMFRDPLFFRAFRKLVLPNLLQQPVIRVWHAGCSSGEEVYSLAILFHEAGLYEKVRFYATDISEEIIQKAKDGEMTLLKMQEYTRNYQLAGGKREFSEYYSIEGRLAFIQPFLKKNIVFAPHNLVTDHSFNEFHVILCRNVMIYFNNELKSRVFRLFYQSLHDDGYVCLGTKETIICSDAVPLFTEIDSEQKIYLKKNEK